MNIKEKMQEMSGKVKRVAIVAGPIALGVVPACFAAEGDGSTTVASTITSQVAGLKTDALTVIGAAVGLGVVFWGAKLMWSKFKGMAK